MRDQNSETPPKEYPAKPLKAIEEQAIIEFNHRVSEHGRGRNWIFDEPRAHIFKAVDELFLARGCDDDNDIEGMRQHFANARNHMAFALQIAMIQYGDEISGESGLGAITSLANRWDASPEEIEVFLQNSGFYEE